MSSKAPVLVTIATDASATYGEMRLVDATTGSRTVTLPAPSIGLAPVRVKKTDASSNAVVIVRSGAALIDGFSQQSLLNQYDAVVLVADGTNWHVISGVTSGGLAPAAPPAPTFTTTPSDPSTSSGDVTFAFTSAGATSFQCSLDGRDYETCASTHGYTGLAPGGHIFAVRAVNAGGTSSPTSYSWTVSAPPLPPGNAVLGAGIGIRRGGRP